MNNMGNIGKFIAEKRKQAGMTQETFAEQLGITPQAVSKWENNVGLPDITLLPNIAKVLNVSIDEIFNRNTPQKVFQFPEKHEGLDFIFSIGNRACYSSKEVETIDDEGNILFKDGSIGRLSTGYAENRGIGEIRFIESEEEDSTVTPAESIDQELKTFSSLSLTLNISCEVQILKSPDGIAKIEATGSQKFMKRLQFEVQNNQLRVFFKSENNSNNGNSGNNKINIYVPFETGENLEITINGSSGCNVTTDFIKTELKINGSGDINAKRTETLVATINGSGDINLDSVSESAKMTVNGSGDININTAKNVEAQINGSGDFIIENVSGWLSATIHGAGDMKLGGKVEDFICKIFGCGDIDAKKLTATKAEIVLDGSSDVTIGRIIESSTEKIGKTSTLTVNQRG